MLNRHIPRAHFHSLAYVLAGVIGFAWGNLYGALIGIVTAMLVVVGWLTYRLRSV